MRRLFAERKGDLDSRSVYCGGLEVREMASRNVYEAAPGALTLGPTYTPKCGRNASLTPPDEPKGLKPLPEKCLGTRII
jgi:hypothetical protein